MSRGSYLTGGAETVQVGSCPKSFEQIVANLDRTSPRLVSYGLYLSTVKELAGLFNCPKQHLEDFLAEPWALFAGYRSRQRCSDRVTARGERIVLGEVIAPPPVLDAVRPFAVNPVLDLVIIQMNVQDLISTPRSHTADTQFEARSSFEIDVPVGYEDSLDMFTIRYHRIRFVVINHVDLEMILRAKAAESPSLSLGDVSMLLDPFIPTVTLRSHRTVNAIVDWAVVQGAQSRSLRSTHTDPSGSWKQ